jgi:hypothetical protein
VQSSKMKRLPFINIASLLSVVLFYGCLATSGNKENAVAVAVSEYRKHGGGMGPVECDVQKTGTNWVVTVWGLPGSAGDFAIVTVSTNWNVVGYLPGE